MSETVYLGLGGNVGDSAAIFRSALEMIRLIPNVADLRCSRFYRTTPVGAPSQPPYLNAVCFLRAELSLKQLRIELEAIERRLGKHPKGKEEPRTVDIDLLFFGGHRVREGDFEVPHPRWSERLFVLKPLAELCQTVEVPGDGTLDLRDYLKHFSNPHNETVEVDA